MKTILTILTITLLASIYLVCYTQLDISTSFMNGVLTLFTFTSILEVLKTFMKVFVGA